MDYETRYVNDVDIDHVLRKLSEARATSDKAWLLSGKYAAASTYLRQACRDGNCIMVGDIFVMFQSASSWCGTDKILSEQLVLRLGPAGTLEQVVHMLERVAEVRGCTGVLVGTALATSDRALTRIYERLGFTVEAVSLFKSIRS